MVKILTDILIWCDVEDHTSYPYELSLINWKYQIYETTATMNKKLYTPPALTINNAAFCPQMLFMGPIWFLEKVRNYFLTSVPNWSLYRKKVTFFIWGGGWILSRLHIIWMSSGLRELMWETKFHTHTKTG